MTIDPNQDLIWALLLAQTDGYSQSEDCNRKWGGSRTDLADSLKKGKIALIIYDGVGTREAVEPNKHSWLMVEKCDDPYRGCALHRIDGPSPERMLSSIEQAKLIIADIKLGNAPTDPKGGRL